MLDALDHQAHASAQLGSTMYQQLFTGLAHNYASHGEMWHLLHNASARPLHEATPLRLAGTIHRLVLQGAAPQTAQHYPSVGGTPTESFVDDFISACGQHPQEVAQGLCEQVQTNEVGRSTVLLALANWLPSVGVDEFDYLEIGASAGLNLSFDSYCADTGSGFLGDPKSTVQFPAHWFITAPVLALRPARVLERRGTDAFPIDLWQQEQRTRLLSFIWPDQSERFGRTRIAIDIALANKYTIDCMSADEWIETQLPLTFEQPVVVFHSIVWQYLHTDVRKRFVSTLSNAGARATPDAPLLWARMEPAGAVADLQVDIWTGISSDPQHFTLAQVGFHGQQLKWL